MSEQRLGTVVIGGSQAGLAVGYYLNKGAAVRHPGQERPRSVMPGGKRWESLRLFTPARYAVCRVWRFPDCPGPIRQRTRPQTISRRMPMRSSSLSEPASGLIDCRSPGIVSK